MSLWIDNNADFAGLCREAAQHSSIALDTEFIWSSTFYPRLALIQLSWDREHCALIDPLAVSDATPLAALLERPALLAYANAVREAVYAHCVKERDGKWFFAWSVDLLGEYDIYDEPPGSLQLLPMYGFCDEADETWQNTVAVIRDRSYALSFADSPIAEIGCKHAPHPWVLSICNSLLSGHAESALTHLRRTRMDNGVACESINEVTGVCETGEAFATCAGFLAYSLGKALGAI